MKPCAETDAFSEYSWRTLAELELTAKITSSSVGGPTKTGGDCDLSERVNGRHDAPPAAVIVSNSNR